MSGGHFSSSSSRFGGSRQSVSDGRDRRFDERRFHVRRISDGVSKHRADERRFDMRRFDERRSGGPSRGSDVYPRQKPVWTPPPSVETDIVHQRVDFSAKKDGEFFFGTYTPRSFDSSPTRLLRSGYTRMHASVLPEDPELFVVGITYAAGDSQCSITGTAERIGHEFEDPALAAIREAQEELGLTCDLSVMRKSSSEQSGRKTWYTFAVPVMEMRPLTPSEVIRLPPKTSFTGGKRPPSDIKVQLYVYGTREELLSTLAQVRMRTCEETDITGVVLLRSDQIRTAFPQS